jgi:LysM repeat protein
MRSLTRLIIYIILYLTPAADCQSIVDSGSGGSIETPADSARTADQKEVDFQEAIDALFLPESLAIDTAGWSAEKINVAPFDYRGMCDTVRIVLRDSLKKRFFVYPDTGPVSSPFGLRRSFWHYGIDIKVRRRDTIKCAFDGMVRVIQNDRHGYGKVVVIRHPDKIETLYGHLSKTLVTANQRIKAGDAVGLGGNSGHSTGTHLHFEIRYRGEPFDPNTVIDFENGTLKSDTLVLSKENFVYLAEARSTVTHVIRKGETLGSIARRHGTTVSKLCSLNGIKPRTILRIGRKIVIRKNPLPDDSTQDSGAPVPSAADSLNKEQPPCDSTKSMGKP